MYVGYLNDFLLLNKGKNITFSIGKAIPNKHISIIIYGTRTNGATYQEESTTNGREITCTIAEDFIEINNIELRFNRSNTIFTDTSTIISNLQLEQGSTATDYEPYIDKKIYCKNDNGVFEEFVPKLEPINITTGEEFETGRMFYDKKEYGKRINCGECPNTQIKEVSTGLRNVYYLSLEGMATNGSIWFPINNTRPTDGTDAGSIGAYIENDNIMLSANNKI